MTDRDNNAKRRYADSDIGLFALLGIGLLWASWGWWKNSCLESNCQRFTIAFRDVAGLNMNAPVQIDGLKVGKVDKIDLAGKNRVLVGVQMNNPHVKVTDGCNASIHAAGVVGAKYVEITCPDSSNTAEKVLGENSVLIGQTPMRSEYIMEKFARNIESFDLSGIRQDLKRDMDKLGTMADNASCLAKKLNPAADRARVMEDRITSLAVELNNTTKKELKETLLKSQSAVKQAEIAGKQVSTLADELNSTNRNDLRTTLSKTQSAVQQISRLADELNSTNKNELRTTLLKTQSAVEQTETVGKQLGQILDKRHPLLHAVFGRPGHLKQDPAEGKNGYVFTQRSPGSSGIPEKNGL